MEDYMSKILVVEDDRYLQRDLKEILMRKAYQVQTASTKQEGMQYILNQKDIDLYLLDVWLPDGDGFELCTQIRKQNLKPVIFLTACDDEESVVKGLDMGADDYISKPFRIAELVSRIQANLRRQKQTVGTVMICDDIVLDVVSAGVSKAGKDLGLRPFEYRLLHTLMRHAGRIVKREQLLEMLWEEMDESVEDNTLSVHISRLRRKLGIEYIETIRGFGYRFTKPVQERIGG